MYMAESTFVNALSPMLKLPHTQALVEDVPGTKELAVSAGAVPILVHVSGSATGGLVISTQMTALL